MSELNSESPREQLLSLLHNEFSRIKTQLTELEALVQQTHNEVERLQQKNAMVTNRLHQIEANFDSVPRPDIRVAYNEALDTRSRLLTMRGNLEKLQSDQNQLRQMADIISKVLAQVEGLAPAAFQSEAAAAETSPAAINIIRIIEAQENERKRLARQMHDGPAQSLTNFILQAEICQRLFDRNPDRAAEELNNLKSVASSTFQKVRDFIFDLRPMMLDDLGGRYHQRGIHRIDAEGYRKGSPVGTSQGNHDFPCHPGAHSHSTRTGSGHQYCHPSEHRGRRGAYDDGGQWCWV